MLLQFNLVPFKSLMYSFFMSISKELFIVPFAWLFTTDLVFAMMTVIESQLAYVHVQ